MLDLLNMALFHTRNPEQEDFDEEAACRPQHMSTVVERLSLSIKVGSVWRHAREHL